MSPCPFPTTITITPRAPPKGVHAFSKGISLKVNVLPLLEFELVFYDFVVKYVNRNSTRNPLYWLGSGNPFVSQNLRLISYKRKLITFYFMNYADQ